MVTRRTPFLRLAVVAAFAVTLVAPSAVGAASRGAFSYNLYRPGDFVAQFEGRWCVGASIQMMLNIMDVTDDRTKQTQLSYMTLARTLSPRFQQSSMGTATAPAVTNEIRGTSSASWAAGLTKLGGGRYMLRGIVDYSEALRDAATALRQTNRPVGLLVWRGAHAWVLSGFTATGDPLTDPDFQVTGVYVQDPWYGRVSGAYGPGQQPNTWLSAAALQADFLPRRRGRRNPRMEGKYVMVTPIDLVALAYGWSHS